MNIVPCKKKKKNFFIIIFYFFTEGPYKECV